MLVCTVREGQTGFYTVRERHLRRSLYSKGRQQRNLYSKIGPCASLHNKGGPCKILYSKGGQVGVCKVWESHVKVSTGKEGHVEHCKVWEDTVSLYCPGRPYRILYSKVETCRSLYSKRR